MFSLSKVSFDILLARSDSQAKSILEEALEDLQLRKGLEGGLPREGDNSLQAGRERGDLQLLQDPSLSGQDHRPLSTLVLLQVLGQMSLYLGRINSCRAGRAEQQTEVAIVGNKGQLLEDLVEVFKPWQALDCCQVSTSCKPWKG